MTLLSERTEVISIFLKRAPLPKKGQKMAGIVIDTKIHPSEKYDRVRFRSDQGGAGPSTLTERQNQETLYYEMQTDLTLEEAHKTEMRKKIPGLVRIPKDRIDTQRKESDFHEVGEKVKHVYVCIIQLMCLTKIL